MDVTAVVRAAGGVVARDGPDGLEVVAVHRPRYGDWSFPKGKLEGDETYEAAALREVREETSLGCRLVRELESTRYRDSRGRPKVVRYWLMEAVSGVLGPANEVDEARWVALDEARSLLTYARDVGLLDSLART